MACGCWVVSCKDVSPDLDEPFRKLWWANHLSEAVFLELSNLQLFRAFKIEPSVQGAVFVMFLCVFVTVATSGTRGRWADHG